MLAFKTEVQAEFEKILSAKIENNLSDAALGKLIHAVVSDEDVKNYAVEVSEVNDSLKAELAEEIKNGLEIRPTKGVRAGFRLAAKDGSGYFDCSDDEIMQMGGQLGSLGAFDAPTRQTSVLPFHCGLRGNCYAWRLSCEDGSAYGIDPANYETRGEYDAALFQAKQQ